MVRARESDGRGGVMAKAKRGGDVLSIFTEALVILPFLGNFDFNL